MVVLRRRRKRPDHATGATGFDPDTAAERVLAAAEAALGARPALAEGPEPVIAGAGPDAYTFALDTDDPEWSGQLVARTSASDVLAREATWVQGLEARGFPAPELVCDRQDDGLLVFRPPDGENLLTLMTTELMSLPDLLASFGRMHARLHGLPVGDLAEPDDEASDPVEELAELAAATTAGRKPVDRELGWLQAHRPATTGPDPGTGTDTDVLCHGDLNPGYVFVWRGDEPRELAVNWMQARVGPPAFDVAATLTTFWIGPIYVANVAQRTMLKMARDSLASAYLAAYERTVGEPLDETELAYWQAFHLCQLALHLADIVHGGPDLVGPWHPAAGVVQPEKALQDVRNRFWELANS
ncbi:MAG TPA: phosphotransferase [Acidimicrobiales bacterium]|nr:phosphotransferase [Acidimicrobiales bacterium]